MPVMPGPVPGIHDLKLRRWKAWMHGTSPDKPGHDEITRIGVTAIARDALGAGTEHAVALCVPEPLL
jgi:hypothetical protein